MDLCFVIKRATPPLQSEGRLDYSPYVYSLLHWNQICTIVHSQVCGVHLNRKEKLYDKSDHVYKHYGHVPRGAFISAPIDAKANAALYSRICC
ncbi:hypothetical protein AVEN_182852-1 [Araneus ventricosus]|uniref:Uncharacterized protein n=1 Tax=Araneus ventricosus TaxID=182803 RepID=A0A4Y2BBA2_ARAVE|nr:hypothetical protein AVEN_182852-1 [Araneus ventricosus]